MRNVAGRGMVLGLVGCVATDQISFAVDADGAFVHEEPIFFRSEGISIIETDVPGSVDIAVDKDAEEIVFEGALPAGEYPFVLDFEHYGDGGIKKTRWDVTIRSK